MEQRHDLSLVAPAGFAEQPPENVEAEQMLLGTLLLNNEAVFQIPRSFQVKHFYEALHQRIYEAIIALTSAGKTASPVTLKAQFDGDETLGDIGGAAYLMNLVANTGVIHIPDFCELITHCWMRRELIAHYQAKIAEAHAGQIAPDSLAANSASTLSELAASIALSAPRSDYEVGVRILDRLKSDDRPFSTGLSRLDEAMSGGLFPGRLYGFAAKQKSGKTVMAGTISHNLRLNGHKHLFICAEMSAEEIYQRILARMLGCYESAFRSEYGQSSHFQQQLAQAITDARHEILFEDRPGITLPDLLQLIALYATKHKITGFILDYWQLVGGKQKNESDAKHLDRVAQSLADCCKKFNLWGITMAQINREGNIRDGDGLLNACDQGYIMHRPDDSQPPLWLEMKASRYTHYMDIGDEISPGFILNPRGPYFEQFNP